ncbi:MAG: LacI family DNA-binding transcriptional regulator [Pseudogulbenkiania sp.]|nr:LacI family DNA-binding transcriptional regulator [Pseudogulbenkiania sp.]
MRKKTVAADVAIAAGVSLATVDRVLNGRGGVSAEKERKVLEWARKLKLDRDLERRPTRTLRIGVLMQAPSNPFYAALQRAFIRANDVYFSSNIQITQYYYDVLDLAGTAKLLARLPKSQDALIVILPADPLIERVMEKVTAAIPVITMASDLPSSGRMAYVGLDNHSAGRAAGDLMGRFLGEAGGKIAIVSGLHSFTDQGEREAGFRQVLAERYPGCELDAVLETREQPEVAGSLVHKVLRQNPAINGIYNLSTGDRSIVEGIKRLGREHDTVVITHELTVDRKSLLKEGAIDAVIDQNPELEALSALNILANHFGRGVDKLLSMQAAIAIYTRENC